MKLLRLLLAAMLSATVSLPALGQGYEWTTFAGSTGGVGFRDGPLAEAGIRGPMAVATAANGTAYLTDTGHHTIRMITSDGMVSTLAGKPGVSGSVDGTGDRARFNNPGAITVDGGGNLYVADTGNHTIRKISPAGTVSTLAGEAGVAGHSDGAGNAAHFFLPAAITLAANGDLLVADTANHLIRRITPDGLVSTFAGQAGIPGSTNGNISVALFNTPRGLAIDNGGTLYITDSANRVIREITADGNVATRAGLAGVAGSVDGIGSAARFSNPNGIVIDVSQNIYVTDFNSRTIRKIAASDNSVTTLAGKAGTGGAGSADGSGANAQFTRPGGMAVASDGSLLVADSGNNTLRNVTTAGVVTTLIANSIADAGAIDATGTSARFRIPSGLTVGGTGTVYVADTGNRTIRAISASGVVSTFAGTAGLSGTADASGANARFTSPRAVTLGPGGTFYVADVVDTRNSTIRKISPAGVVSTLAGTPGTLAAADTLYFVNGVAVDSVGNVFASDLNSIRKITSLGVVSLFAGEKRFVFGANGEFLGWNSGITDGTGEFASFIDPTAVAIDSGGNLYITESRGGVIRKVTPGRQVTTLAGLSNGSNGISGANDGTGTTARFLNPKGIAVDAHGTLYISDTGNHTIRKMSPAGVVTTIGGLAGYAGSGDGIGDRSLFNGPSAVTVDSSGNVYVADTVNQRIVKGVPLPVPEIVVQHPDGSHLSIGGPGLEFGSVVPSATTPTQILRVYNTGKTQLDISNLELIGNHISSFTFDRSGLPISLPPDGTGVIRVTFSPSGLGSRSASLRISNNDPDEGSIEISLHGTGNSLPVFSGYAVSSPPVATVSISIAKLLSAAIDPDGDALTVTSVGWPTTSGGGLVLQSDSILFSPSSPYFNGTWTFLVTITDARGGSVTGNVSVTWQSSTTSGSGSMTTNPPQLTMQAGGKPRIAFHGIPGRTYLIQRSQTLTTWENVANITADPTGNVIFNETSPPLPNAYYRIAIP